MDITEVKGEIDKIAKAIDAKTAEHTAQVEQFGKATTELTGQIDKLSEQYKGLKEQMIDLAQKQTPASTDAKSETAGMEFVSSEAFKSMVSGQIGSTTCRARGCQYV